MLIDSLHVLLVFLPVLCESLTQWQGGRANVIFPCDLALDPIDSSVLIVWHVVLFYCFLE